MKKRHSGSPPRPGEISLAHHGVLFLDELPEFQRPVLDSLRHWVNEFHVDGFRFDLAPVLGRTDHGFARNSPFFMALAQDPVLCGVTMIAEPWDLGPGGYQSGGHGGQSEWQGGYGGSRGSDWNQRGFEGKRRPPFLQRYSKRSTGLSVCWQQDRRRLSGTS